MINIPEFENTDSVRIPEWYNNYVGKLFKDEANLVRELDLVAEMNYSQLNNHLGGSIDELPYEVLGTLLINGTDDEKVANILRLKRQKYLEKHPEEYKGVRGAQEGIIGFDGIVHPMSDWRDASMSEKIGVLVGSTCFHYNSDTPGMSSSPKDRF